jgi:uncharacterized protein
MLPPQKNGDLRDGVRKYNPCCGGASYHAPQFRYNAATVPRFPMVDDIPGLRRILKTNKVIAVVGLSASWHRPSYFAAKYMLDHGYTVIPVNPGQKEILGQKCYASLREVAEKCALKVDMVDCFRKTADIMPIAEDAIAIGARVLWQQLGVKNVEAAKKAEAAGLESVMDRCVKIEHARLFGGLNWCGVNTRVISAKRPQWLPY